MQGGMVFTWESLFRFKFFDMIKLFFLSAVMITIVQNAYFARIIRLSKLDGFGAFNYLKKMVYLKNIANEFFNY